VTRIGSPAIGFRGAHQPLWSADQIPILHPAVEVLRESGTRASRIRMWGIAPVVTATRHAGTVVVAIVSLLLVIRRAWHDGLVVAGLIIALVSHLQFAVVGGFKYEANLIGLGLVGIAVTTVSMQSAGGLLPATACLVPAMWRAWEATMTRHSQR
jgi:hypothetical protein